MSNRGLKWMTLIIVPVFVVLAVRVFLFAEQPAPTPPAGAPHTAAVALPNPASTMSTSTQPKITWAPTSTEVILSPGESTSRDFALTSNIALQNAVIEAVPQIASFLSIQPSTFASIPAGQPQPVHISYVVPAGTVLGSYSGTIRVRIGNGSLPQTLKVTVNVWTQVTEPTTGWKFLI